MQDRAMIYQSEIDLTNLFDARVIAMNFIKENSIILDIGCACGDLGIALKQYKNCNVFGFEYNAESVEIAKKTNAYVNVHQVDLNNYNNADFSDYFNKFDYIILGDVLEHLYFPQQILNNLKCFLKNDGYFILSIPNISHISIKANLLLDDWTYTPYGLLDETHIKFFTAKSLPKFLSDINLEIKDVVPKTADILGYQPTNPYPYLPMNIKKYLLKDWHSLVSQYVMKVKISDTENETLLKNNYNKLNPKVMPQNIKRAKIEALRDIRKNTFLKDKIKPLRYKLLSMITTGKAKEKYLRKYKEFQ